MSDGRKFYYTRISATSNTVVQTRMGRLQAVVGTFPTGSIVRIDDAHSFNAGVLNINAASSNTIGHFSANVTDLGIGVNTGLVVSVSSNAQITIVHE
jgi:hypothetical protein